MKYNRIFIGFWILLLTPLLVLAQEEETNDLGTQEVIVIKSYSPSLKNVFKIRTNPKMYDSLIQKKLGIDYTFEPIPVVSTFIPNKASPLKLQRQKSSFYHNSYASGGLGNQSFFKLDLSSMVTLDRSQSIGLKFLYASLGSIEGTLLNSEEKRTSLDLIHQYKQNNMRVDSDLRYDRQAHNFFGLYDLNWQNIPSFRPDVIDPSQKLNYISIRSRWQWYDSVFRKVHFSTHITTDSFESTEHIVNINTQLRVPIFDQYLEFKPHVEMVNTNFVRGYLSESELNSQKAMAELAVQFLSIGQKLNLKLGAQGFYPFGLSGEEEMTSFYVYPKAEISYKSGNGKLVPFLKYEGSLDLNSFMSFSLENPYVAPTLEMKFTEVNHNANVGFNANPGSGLSFKFNMHYSQTDNFPMFSRLPYDYSNEDMAYRMGNAYEVIYAALEKMGFITQVALRFNEFNKINFETAYYEYKREGGGKVLNLPSITIDLNANFRLVRKIFFQLGGQYLGDRNSIRNLIVPFSEYKAGNIVTAKSLGSIILLASSLTWKINEQWDLFYENKIILGDSTSRWAYYQNQSQLHLGGIRYKFDLNL